MAPTIRGVLDGDPMAEETALSVEREEGETEDSCVIIDLEE